MTTKSNNNADTELLVTLAGGPMTFGRALKTIRECEAMSLGALTICTRSHMQSIEYNR